MKNQNETRPRTKYVKPESVFGNDHCDRPDQGRRAGSDEHIENRLAHRQFKAHSRIHQRRQGAGQFEEGPNQDEEQERAGRRAGSAQVGDHQV